MTKAGMTAIRHARVIDGTGRHPLNDRMILIDGDRIAAVVPDSGLNPGAATEIDARGKTVIPGLIDMHAHLLSGGFDSIVNASASYDTGIQTRALNQMLYWGVTGCHYSVQPVANGQWLRQAVATGEIAGPRLWISGPGITAPDGWAGSTEPDARLELDDVAVVPDAIARLADSGVNFVKVFYDDMCCAFHRAMPKLRKPVMERVIAEAHRYGLPVAVHVYELDGHRDVLRAGGDLLYHSAVTGSVDDGYIKLARASGAAYVATLSIYHDTYNPDALREWAATSWVRDTVPSSTRDTLLSGGPLDDFESFTRRAHMAGNLPTIMANIRKVHEAGIVIAVGPDTGVPGVFPGLSLHREMELMVRAGIPPLAVISAATGTAAHLVGDPWIGAVAPGKSADLVLLDADPLTDIRATRAIHAIWKAGVPVDRHALLRKAALEHQL